MAILIKKVILNLDPAPSFSMLQSVFLSLKFLMRYSEMFITVEKKECEMQVFTYQSCLNICWGFDGSLLSFNPIFSCSCIQLSKLL